MLMGEVSMGLTGDEDMTIVPSVLQFLFCFFSLHTNWSMKEVERDTSHKQRPAGHGRGRECSCQDGVDSLSQYLSLLCPINSLSAENEDKSLSPRNLHAASPSFCGTVLALQMAHHLSPPLSYHLVSRFCQVLGVKA